MKLKVKALAEGLSKSLAEGEHARAVRVVLNCKSKELDARLAPELSGPGLEEVQGLYCRE